MTHRIAAIMVYDLWTTVLGPYTISCDSPSMVYMDYMRFQGSEFVLKGAQAEGFGFLLQLLGATALPSTTKAIILVGS